jgi:hypothetical protein
VADPLPASTKVENEWNYACSPSYAFMSCALPFLPLCVSIMTINQLSVGENPVPKTLSLLNIPHPADSCKHSSGVMT